ncbi:MAG: mismatch-specific DNA-glycosylase [Chloroflexi bacterium]|nr:mismatch-specific DNA-glycosylase [Chloroflexota bacterium]
MPEVHRPITLPDLLRPGLSLVFVGINPSVYSAERGHYFARPGNRFWPAFSASQLSREARLGLGVDVLGPRHDGALIEFGIGFTDVVKRPSVKAAQVTPAEFAAGALLLAARLAPVRPAAVCFHGVTGFRPFAQHALGLDPRRIVEGEQVCRVAGARVFVVPNPSGANAHVTLAQQTAWYDRLALAMQAPRAAAD